MPTAAPGRRSARVHALAGVIGLVGVCASGSARLAAQPPAWLLAPGQAGPIEIGVTVDEVYRRVGRDATRLVDRFTEGMFDPALAIDLPGARVGPAVVAPIGQWTCGAFAVRAIDVRDPRFRTRDGLGVGATLADVQQRYRATVSDEEGPHIHVPELEMSFRLANGSRAPDTRITAVWLYAGVERMRAIRAARCPGR